MAGLPGLRVGVAAAVALSAGIAAAQVPDYAGFVIPDGASERVIAPAHFTCMGERGYDAEGSRACVDAELARLRPRLEAALAAADSGAAASQAEWTETLGVRCDAEAALEGAAMAPLVRDGCRLDETVRRILWLEGPARAR